MTPAEAVKAARRAIVSGLYTLGQARGLRLTVGDCESLAAAALGRAGFLQLATAYASTAALSEAQGAFAETADPDTYPTPEIAALQSAAATAGGDLESYPFLSDLQAN